MARIIISILLIFFSFQSHSQIAMFHAHNQMPSNLFLDLYPNATGAYSVRKLDKDYTGFCMRVLNSSLATRDIGFVNGILDTTDLLSWTSGGTAWVIIWYDQSGSGRNLYNASGYPNAPDPSDTINAPKIVRSGTLQRIGSLPALFFDGTTDLMSALATKTSTTSQSSVVVFNQNGGENFARIISQRDTLRRDFDDYIPVVRNGTTSSFTTNASASGLQASKTLTANTSYIWLNTHSGSQIRNSINNDTDATFTHTLNVTPYRYRLSGSYDVATTEGTDQQILGFIAEAVWWGNVNQSSNKSGIFSNINSYYSIY